jgi:cytoskeleton protein RodZ
METIGSYLRKERESQHISIEEVVARTRIQKHFLSAIEEDHLDQIPHLVSRNGFIRNYARFLQLNEAETFKRFPIVPEPVPVGLEQPKTAPPLVAHQLDMGVVGVEKSPSLVNNFMKTFGVGALVLSVLLLFVSWLSTPSEVSSPIKASSGKAASSVPAPKPFLQESGSVSPLEAVRPSAPLEGALPLVKTEIAKEPPPPLPTVLPAPSKPVPEGRAAVKTTEVKGKKIPAIFPSVETLTIKKPDAPVLLPPASVPTGNTPTPLTLLLKASERSWIRVLIDGKESKDALLKAGDVIALKASERFLLTIGNAGGMTASLNGKDMGVLGQRREVIRDWLLTRQSSNKSKSGMKKPPTQKKLIVKEPESFVNETEPF